MRVEKNKKESLERLKNNLEQAKLNLKLATQNNDLCDVKYWSKQVRLQSAVLQRVLELESKKS